MSGIKQADLVTGVVTSHIHGHTVASVSSRWVMGKWAPVPVSISRNQLLLLSGAQCFLCVQCWFLHQSNWQLLHLNYRRRWQRSEIPLCGGPSNLKSKMSWRWNTAESPQRPLGDVKTQNNHWWKRGMRKEELKQVIPNTQRPPPHWQYEYFITYDILWDGLYSKGFLWYLPIQRKCSTFPLHTLWYEVFQCE